MIHPEPKIPTEPRTEFAGFTYPRAIAAIHEGPLLVRLSRRKLHPMSGPYFWDAPRMAGKGCGFYLGEDRQFVLRWKPAHMVDSSIHHTGWYCDEFQDQTIYGIVLRLPHGRGFLAGWTMGEGMASSVDTDYVIENEIDAAHVADGMAERAADAEREYEARERAANYEDFDARR